MPTNLPISVASILDALRHAVCTECRGLGRRRTKVRCPTCNGKGTENVIVEICAVCQGYGQIPDAKLCALECALCEGFGAIYRECWECRHNGFILERDDYCGRCNGAGEVPLARKVAETGDRTYISHLVRRLEEYSSKGTEEDLAKACAIDGLLHDALRHSREMSPRRDKELFSEELRILFGAARVRLGQEVRRQEDRCLRERRQGRSEYLAAVARLRSRSIEMQGHVADRFWHGLGYGWDRSR